MNIDEHKEQATKQAVQPQVSRRFQPPSWQELFSSISLAGATYAAAWVFFAAIWACVVALIEWTQGRPPAPEHIISFLVALMAGGLYGFVLGMIYTALVSTPVLAIVAGMLRMMDWRPRWDQLGVFCGGLAGYVATFPAAYLLYESWAASWAQVLFWFLVPTTAICFGQVGGAIAGVENYARQKRREELAARPLPRFSVRQLLSLMAIISVALAMLRAAGLLESRVLLITLAWLGMHFVGRSPALFLARRIHHRRQAKRRRKREAMLNRWRAQSGREHGFRIK